MFQLYWADLNPNWAPFGVNWAKTEWNWAAFMHNCANSTLIPPSIRSDKLTSQMNRDTLKEIVKYSPSNSEKRSIEDAYFRNCFTRTID